VRARVICYFMTRRPLRSPCETTGSICFSRIFPWILSWNLFHPTGRVVGWNKEVVLCLLLSSFCSFSRVLVFLTRLSPFLFDLLRSQRDSRFLPVSCYTFNQIFYSTVFYCNGVPCSIFISPFVVIKEVSKFSQGPPYILLYRDRIVNF